MSKYRVPEAGLKAAVAAAWRHIGFSFPPQASPVVRKEIEESFRTTLEAFIAWQSDHPVVPTDEQYRVVCESEPNAKLRLVEWQRRIYLALEPEYIGEEEIGRFCGRFQRIDEAVREAYRRGQQSK